VLLAVAVAVSFVLAACGGNDREASPIQAGLVDPGTYESKPFEPAFLLTIDEQGWRALFAAEDDEIAFEHDDGRLLAFTRVTRVVDPKTGRDVQVPKDLAQWLSNHPALQPTRVAPISVGGASGTRIDAAPTRSETDIFWYPTGAMHADPDVRWRIIVLDAGGTPLTIVVGAPKASFDQAVKKTRPLLASIEFD
jgi:hypothetical protein